MKGNSNGLILKSIALYTATLLSMNIFTGYAFLVVISKTLRLHLPNWNENDAYCSY